MRLLLCLLTLLLCCNDVRSQQQPTAQSESYRLQPEDTISVFYRLTPEFNQSLTILPDGDVNLRLIGCVHVAGLLASEAENVIASAAAKRLRNPEVSVSVTDFAREEVTMMGELQRPGRYELHGQTTLAEALALAGGFTTSSAQRRVVLVRSLGPGSAFGNATIFDFKNLLKTSASTSVPFVRARDIVVVTTSKFAKVSGVIRLVNIGLFYNPASN